MNKQVRKRRKKLRNTEEEFEVLSLPLQSHRSVCGKGIW